MTIDLRTRDTFAFLDFELTPYRRRLVKGSGVVTIGGRAFDLLVLFAGRPGEVLGSETLIRGVWPETVVEECNLRVQIAALRRLLGHGGKLPCIATVPGRGYCFTPPVMRLAPAPCAGAALERLPRVPFDKAQPAMPILAA